MTVVFITHSCQSNLFLNLVFKHITHPLNYIPASLVHLNDGTSLTCIWRNCILKNRQIKQTVAHDFHKKFKHAADSFFIHIAGNKTSARPVVEGRWTCVYVVVRLQRQNAKNRTERDMKRAKMKRAEWREAEQSRDKSEQNPSVLCAQPFSAQL